MMMVFFFIRLTILLYEYTIRAHMRIKSCSFFLSHSLEICIIRQAYQKHSMYLANLDTVFIVRYRADKHNLGEKTQSEMASIVKFSTGEKKVLAC